MLDSNKTISGLWVGDSLSDLERLCICSFIAHGHDFVLYAYNDIANVPLNIKGGGQVEVRDANEILSRKNIFHAKGTYAEFSDWFRWELMLQKGGWYVDMDMVCLRPFDFAEEIVMCREEKGRVNNAVLKFSAGHKVAAAIVDACESPNKIQPWDNKKRVIRKLWRKVKFWQNPHIKQKWGEAGGPGAMDLVIKHFNLGDAVLPPQFFNSTYFYCTDYCLNSSPFADALGDIIIQHSHGVHLLNSGWRGRGWDKISSFPSDTLYEKLKRQYLPEYIDNKNN